MSSPQLVVFVECPACRFPKAVLAYENSRKQVSDGLFVHARSTPPDAAGEVRSVNIPIRYELDDVHRRVTVTVKGPLQPDDMRGILARQWADLTWTYGMLYDLRGMTGEVTVTDLRQLMGEPDRQDEGLRGPVALLVTDQAVYRRLCTCAALGRSTTLTIAVFRDRSEAERWLDSKPKH
jgi:hypothetical protein